MSYEIAAPNTGATLAAQSPEGLAKLWKKGVEMYEQTNDFFQQFEGKSSTSLIRVETDTSKGRGQKITFRNLSGFYGEGKSGEELFESSSDYEKLYMGDYELEVDFLRNATRWSARTEEHMGMRGDIVMNVPKLLGEWMGRAKTDRLFMKFLTSGTKDNYTFGGKKGSADDLVSADTLSANDIIAMQAKAKVMGGRPAMAAMDKGNPIFRMCVVAETNSLYSLKTDSDYRQLLRDAGQRGSANHLFKGGYADIEGNVIKEYSAIHHDGYGPIGSPLTPQAALGEAITAANTAQAIKGGGDATGAAITDVLYFKHFPKHAYEFLPSDVLDIAGGDSVQTWTDYKSNFYILIYNTSGADVGKFGFYEVSANNGNQLTMEKRLRASDQQAGANIAYDAIGDVTWNTGPWANLHTDSHPVGSLIFLANKKGVPIGHTLMLGANCALRGYGIYRNKRGEDSKEADFLQERYITSVFGQAPRRDRRNRCPGFLQLTHALDYPGIDFPTIT